MKLNIFPPSLPLYELPGLKATYRGKVRARFDLPNHPELMLVANTDQVSVHNFA